MWRGCESALKAPDAFGRLLAIGFDDEHCPAGFFQYQRGVNLVPAKVCRFRLSVTAELRCCLR